MSNPIENPRPPDQGLEPAPRKVKLMYGMGNSGFALVEVVMVSWLMYYFLPSTGKSGGALANAKPLVGMRVFGIIFFLGNLFDAFAEPLVSHWSDNFKSRLGRRWPFMLTGGVPLAVCLVALFMPRLFNLTQVMNTVYLAAFLFLFFFFFTCYVCPYLALLTELSHSDADRVNLSTLLAVFMLVGTIIGMQVPPLLLGKIGFTYMALIMGIIAIVFMYIPVLGLVNEKKYCHGTPSGLSVIQSLMATLRNRPFVIYLIGNLLFWFGFNIIRMGLPYYVVTLVGQKEDYVSLYLAITFGIAAVMFVPVNILAQKFGKRKIMIAALGIFMITLPLIFLLEYPGFPVRGNKIMIIIMAFAGFPIATLFTIPNAITAELAHYESVVSGVQREAMYFGTQGFFLKLSTGLSTNVMIELFKRYGYKSAGESMGLRLTGPIAGVFALVGMLMFLVFPKDLPAAFGLDKNGVKLKSE